MGQFNERPHAQITVMNAGSPTLIPPGKEGAAPNFYGDGFLISGPNSQPLVVREGPGRYLLTLENSNAIGPNELGLSHSLMNDPLKSPGPGALTMSVSKLPEASDLPVPYTKLRVTIVDGEGLAADPTVGFSLRVDRVRVALPGQ